MKNRVSLIIVSFLFLLGLVVVFSLVSATSLVATVSASALSDLPFGSVIQVMPTDTYMCNDTTNCTATTNNVLPFKFVKMLARQTNTNATALGNQSGYIISGQEYTYWMLLDNYCWWGKSDCRHYGGTRRSNGTSWNGETNVGQQSNNITDTKSYNFLKVLANFYESLPAEIGGVAKETAVPVFSWDMYGVSNGNPPTVGWSGGTWNNTTYNPGSNPASQFSFTGSNSAPIMNSRIGLVSVHEWQGGNIVYSTNPTSNDGSGGSYCYQRFGTANCQAASGFMFNDTNTSAGNQSTIASAANPRPNYPWTRSPFSTDSATAGYLQGGSSSSLYYSTVLDVRGVSPTLWLSSNISTTDGAGTYDSPYNLSPLNCDDPANKNKLDCLETGTAIQITGQGGAEYKFIKLKPMDDDGNVMNHSDGSNGSYWMLADNYCGLAGRPSNCVNNSSGETSTTYNYWNPTSDGTRLNNWTTMANTQYGVYQQVLTPMLNDLPTTIGSLSKDSAILTKAYPMYSIIRTPGTGTTTKSSCYLTAGSVIETGTANTSNCTWTDKISLPSYTDWQDGLNGMEYYAPAGSNADAYSMTRFGTAWGANGSFGSWYPWLRSPYASDTSIIYNVYGFSSTSSVSFSGAASNSYGVSPSLWLSSEIILDGTGNGTYADPYHLNSALSQNSVSLSAPVASWNNSTQVLNVTGIVGYPVGGQSVLIWAAACNTAGQCKQKSATVIITNNGFQAYNLTWLTSELPAGEFDGTIWVGAHVIASQSNEDNAFNQSNSVDFTISPRTMDLSVTKNRAFNLNLGDAAIFNLTPGTNQGVTVAVDSTTNDLLISGTLTQDTQIPFGSTILNFKTFEIPQSVVINDSLSLQ